MMKNLVPAGAMVLAALCSPASRPDTTAPAVTVIRVPNGGIQPQVMERDGIVHMIYFRGDPQRGNLFYVRSKDYGTTFSAPIQINRETASAIAVGNIRGAQLALGRNGRVHVAWNGADDVTDPGAPARNAKPMLYARMNDAGTAFDPERNVIRTAWGINGGGSLAADARGNVYVFWHAPSPGMTGEGNRRVWMARSTDDGKSFAPETVVYDPPVGVCGCCGMKAFADTDGTIYALFRSATEAVNRDMYLIASADGGRTFGGADISKWTIGACVMSSESMVESRAGIAAAWETEQQVWFAAVKAGTAETGTPIPAPGPANRRKYPALATNRRGDTLLAWTEGMGWKKGGTAAWQVFDASGRPEPIAGTAEGVPVWSLVAAFARADGGFAVVY